MSTESAFDPLRSLATLAILLGMKRTAATLFFMTPGPVLVLLAYMHIYNSLVGPPWRAGWLTVLVMGLAVVMGLVAIAASAWSRRTKIWTAVGYLVVAIPVAPFLTLLAQCSTGDCI